jgi:DNA-binding transcriptional ArsR family regulator
MKSSSGSPTIDRDLATQWAGWFQAIADPTRILILHLLAVEQRSMSVGEITGLVDVGQSTVSHHLAKLADVGFVVAEQSGTASFWRVNQRCIDAFPSAAEVVLGRVPASLEMGTKS